MSKHGLKTQNTHTTVEERARDDVVPRGRDRRDGHELRGVATGYRECSGAALECSNALLEDILLPARVGMQDKLRERCDEARDGAQAHALV